MAVLRKMLGEPDSPSIMSLKKLIGTQSKETIAHWCISYAREEIIPVYRRAFPQDSRGDAALDAAEAWFRGELKLPAVKERILKAHEAAREAEDEPAAQAAVRAAAHAASVAHSARHSIGLAYYGSAALAYEEAGLKASEEVYSDIADREIRRMEEALGRMADPNEPHPAKN